jgi:outer membrane protein OmpA-like peptidoglycan-associated protein
MEKIGTIYFKNNEYFLDAKDRTELKEISQQINDANFKTVIIQGNTDIKQGVDNFWLSKARAEAVSNYLSGLASAPLYNRVWYASRRPVAIGIDKVSLALNRRVEIYAQVSVEKPASTGSVEPKQTISMTFDDISFNRNEAFLDAGDRKSLLNTVQIMAKSGCTQVFLKGSHDSSKGSVNAFIGTNRAKAVRKFMAGLLPSLKFRMEPEFVSTERVVEIRCTN